MKTANRALNHEFENNKQFSGITVSGIDMENSLIFGMLGIQISPAGINPTIGVKNTQYESLFQGLNAIAVIIPVLDVTGNVTAKVGFTYQYSAYHEKGINMQKKGFVGSHGSLEENKGQVSVPLPYDRSLEIYDVYGRSASEKDVAPQWSVTFGGEGDAGEEVGLGANLGLMISGIVPVAAKASIYEKADVNGSGEIKLGNGLDVPENSGSRAQKNKVSVKADGDIGANMTVGLKAGVYFKLALKVKLPDKDHVEDEDNVEDKARLDSVGFTLGSSDPKEWKHDFCQITIAPITGSVTEEMLVCYTEPSPSDKKYYQIVMHMYEVINGNVVLADSMPFKAYDEFHGGGESLTSSLWADILLDLHVVRLNGKSYLICEEEAIWGSFGDASARDYWVVVYQKDKLQYRTAFSQTAGGSASFQYTGYEFEDGKLIDSQLYYNEGYPTFGDKPLYDDYATSVAAFFSKMGISVITDIEMHRDVQLGTILSENNDKSEIFRFINKETNHDYTSSTYKFTATLNRAEDLGVQ